ncbi:MAG TPA: 1-acyl-sn-glycerol-3-phosphate acyltransferase [Nitrospirae bacterium]|nr:1-acyl-sn-glycerol-3-phosphate acyltransferase [Nitrospirota bacterium]HDK17229.1 1-acyl-sn-glycerol-3-phosphate acyltransferase [Nitrospirota bacterium]
MYKIAKIVQIISYRFIYLSLKFFVRFEVRGQENLTGLENKGVIFASNHASYIDGLISAASMPRRNGEFYPKKFFPVRFLVLDKYFRWKYLLVALYVRINGSIKIFRGGGDLKRSLAGAITALRRGEKIWIFPEGKLTRDGKLQQGKRGVAYLHRETNAPVVPVAINGNFGILSFKTLLRNRKVVVTIGRQIRSLDNPGICTLEAGSHKVMAAIEELLTNPDSCPQKNNHIISTGYTSENTDSDAADSQ